MKKLFKYTNQGFKESNKVRYIKEGSLIYRVAWFFNIESFSIITGKLDLNFRGKQLFYFQIPVWVKIIRYKIIE